MKKQILLPGIALIACSLFSCRNTGPARQEAQAFTTSDSSPDWNYFVKKDTANVMIQSYLTSISGDSANTSLQSLILDADALRTYLKDTSIRKVKVMFAHTLEYIHSGHEGQPAKYTPGALTIILAGYNAAGNYIFAPGNRVPDQALPCPTTCPVTGTAANPLLE